MNYDDADYTKGGTFPVVIDNEPEYYTTQNTECSHERSYWYEYIDSVITSTIPIFFLGAGMTVLLGAAIMDKLDSELVHDIVMNSFTASATSAAVGRGRDD